MLTTLPQSIPQRDPPLRERAGGKAIVRPDHLTKAFCSNGLVLRSGIAGMIVCSQVKFADLAVVGSFFCDLGGLFDSCCLSRRV